MFSENVFQVYNVGKGGNFLVGRFSRGQFSIKLMVYGSVMQFRRNRSIF